ncbi:hypothetical protein HFO89_10975 [Rhizobium leguminosarum]|uniref:hypothetical protein n=1 Tax=Rhizobium leguminosarum TaxID=384 RepID=UPI001C945163|nr:hypothetical protein [Rhizobium leguminosarum]MBY5456882.1 hypothetical protein [Rhizobium leguminosarum]
MSKPVTSPKRRSPKGQVASSSDMPTASQAIIGLHGLGRILEAVRRADLQEPFEETLKSADLLVHLDTRTAIRIQAFLSEKLGAGHDALSMRNNDNCDPRTDPWCIEFVIEPH